MDYSAYVISSKMFMSHFANDIIFLKALDLLFYFRKSMHWVYHNDVSLFAELYNHELCADFKESPPILWPKANSDEGICHTKIGHTVLKSCAIILEQFLIRREKR